MRTSFRSLIALGLAAGLSYPSVAYPSLDWDEATADSPSESLNQLLQREASGQAVDRQSAVGAEPSSDWHGWQAGLLKDGNQWKPLTQLDESNADRVYLAKRMAATQDVEGQLELARWCRDHQRDELARAHYFAVIALDPNHAAARKQLGHVLVGDDWIDAKELQLKRQVALQRVETLKEWAPKLRSILMDLNEGGNKRAATALAKLDKIDTATALPALLVATMNADDAVAQVLVKKIAQVRTREVCLGLVSLACNHPSSLIRQQATDAAREYALEMYVPTLLEDMTTDISVSNQLVFHPNGHVSLDTVLKQELKDKHIHQSLQKSVDILSTVSSRRETEMQTLDIGDIYLFTPGSSDEGTFAGRGSRTNRSASGLAQANATYVPTEVLEATAANLEEQGNQRKLAAEQANRRAKLRQAAVFSFLRKATGQSLGDDATEWWDWWSEHSERYTPGLKPVQKSYATSREKLALDSRRYERETLHAGTRDVGRIYVPRDCLVAGTLVQTSTGPKPIETIKVGDLVVSKAEASAEISLQPVLLTTGRPPKPTWKIVTAADTLQSTGGHPWWVCGKGWTKTRDLRAGDYLHTATGNVVIREMIEDPEPVPTFNLVIDRTHTYFVGTERIMSHDNSPHTATTQPVPGFGKP